MVVRACRRTWALREGGRIRRRTKQEKFSRDSCALTVLANEVEVRVAVGVRPEPSLRSVVPGAVLVPTRRVPKRHGHVLSVEPFPVGPVLRIANGAHPVLTVGVAPARNRASITISVHLQVKIRCETHLCRRHSSQLMNPWSAGLLSSTRVPPRLLQKFSASRKLAGCLL